MILNLNERFKITGRHLTANIDSTAATVMVPQLLNRCMKKEDVDKLDLVIRFKHPVNEAETFFLGKNKYEIVVDHHRITIHGVVNTSQTKELQR